MQCGTGQSPHPRKIALQTIAPRQMPLDNCHLGKLHPDNSNLGYLLPRQLPFGQLSLPQITAPGKFPPRIIDPLGYSYLGLLRLG